jgi:hypothetical protein
MDEDNREDQIESWLTCSGKGEGESVEGRGSTGECGARAVRGLGMGGAGRQRENEARGRWGRVRVSPE